MNKIIDEKMALKLDPFEGDFGDDESPQPLKNKIVIIRKPRKCSFCDHILQLGERARSMTSVFDGEIMSHDFCADCLNKMIKLEIGDLSDFGGEA